MKSTEKNVGAIWNMKKCYVCVWEKREREDRSNIWRESVEKFPKTYKWYKTTHLRNPIYPKQDNYKGNHTKTQHDQHAENWRQRWNLKSRKTNSHINLQRRTKKITKRQEETYPKEYIQTTNKYRKGFKDFPTSLAIREMAGKTIMRYHCIPIKWLK